MAKLKSSTILETIVAILIIAICFEIGVVSVTRILASSQGVNKVKAMFVAEKELANMMNNQEFIDKEASMDKWIVKRTVEKYKDFNNLKVITVEVRSALNIPLVKKQRLIILE